MRCHSPVILVLLAVAAFSLLAAGCGGGGGSPGIASVATTTSAATSPGSGPVAFANCMRTHGIPNWPDPDSRGVFDKAKLQQLGLSVARVRRIEEGPCNRLLPSGPGPQESAQQTRTRVADALSFARCMRSHGVSRFPDPTAQGELTVEMVQAQGIDVRSTAVLRVVRACLPASHGALTPAKVREALNGAGG
jgi:hypothetical protein